MPSRMARRGRWLHPGAWWLWALGLAAAASRTTNPLFLVLIIAVAAFVVHARKPAAPWGKSFQFFLRLGLVVVIVRVLVQILFGAGIGTTVVLPLPGLALPEWMAGVRLGGDVTAESLLMAFYDGLRLATILICIGAANSLASPTRLLKSVPAALYELGVSVVVAMTFTPQLVSDVDRLRTSRRLRGRSTSGIGAIASSAVPVLESALERSVALAAAMDSRGYGRRAGVSRHQRLLTSTLILAGLVSACIGTYALISPGIPGALGLLLTILGFAGAVTGVWLAGRTRTRSKYRPDPWTWPEWAVTCAGAAVAIAFTIASAAAPAVMNVSADPPVWPSLAFLPLAGLALALTPAWTAPPLPESERSDAIAMEPELALAGGRP